MAKPEQGNPNRQEAKRYWAIEGVMPGGGAVREVADVIGPGLSAGLKVVDCDAHFTEPPDLWTSRAPAGLKNKLPHVRRVDGMDMWFCGDVNMGTLGGTVIDNERNKYLGKLSFPTFEQMHPSAYDVDARLSMLDEFGIWSQILYLNSGCTQIGTLLSFEDRRIGEAIISIYNDACAERQARSDHRLVQMALLPCWDGDALINEARRCAEDLGLKGFVLPDKPENYGIPGFLDPYWAPFFELCSDTQLPINFHFASSLDGFSLAWDDFPFERRMAVGSALFYLGNAATLSNFLVSGLFDRYPGLHMVSVESGLGWVPFILEALEYQFDEMMPNEKRKLERRPSEYFRDHFWVCYWFEQVASDRLFDVIGTDRILFETDYPHPTTLYPTINERIEASLGNHSPEVQRQILQDNAFDLYQLPKDVLEPAVPAV